MRKLASTLILFMIFGTSFGQNGLAKRSSQKLNVFDYTYGINPSINTSYFGNSDLYSSSIGFGLGFYFNPHILRTKYQAITQFGFKNYNYQVPDSGTVINSASLTLDLGLKIPMEFLDNSSFILKYSGHQLVGAVSKYQGIKRPGPDEINFVNNLKNKLSHGVYLGFDFNFNSNSSLELGYTFFLNQDKTSDFVDAVPNNLSLSYNVNFSNISTSKTDMQKAQETISKLANDTLYFINQSCKNELPNAQLDSLLKANYTFSKYRVLSSSEIASSRLQTNVVHYAVIGSYYPGEGEPTSSGIFLLDENLNNTDVPYPHFKRLEFDLGINKKLCINGIDNAVFLIQWLNFKLINF